MKVKIEQYVVCPMKFVEKGHREPIRLDTCRLCPMFEGIEDGEVICAPTQDQMMAWAREKRGSE